MGVVAFKVGGDFRFCIDLGRNVNFLKIPGEKSCKLNFLMKIYLFPQGFFFYETSHFLLLRINAANKQHHHWIKF